MSVSSNSHDGHHLVRRCERQALCNTPLFTYVGNWGIQHPDESKLLRRQLLQSRGFLRWPWFLLGNKLISSTPLTPKLGKLCEVPRLRAPKIHWSMTSRISVSILFQSSVSPRKALTGGLHTTRPSSRSFRWFSGQIFGVPRLWFGSSFLPPSTGWNFHMFHGLDTRCSEVAVHHPCGVTTVNGNIACPPCCLRPRFTNHLFSSSCRDGELPKEFCDGILTWLSRDGMWFSSRVSVSSTAPSVIPLSSYNSWVGHRSWTVWFKINHKVCWSVRDISVKSIRQHVCDAWAAKISEIVRQDSQFQNLQPFHVHRSRHLLQPSVSQYNPLQANYVVGVSMSSAIKAKLLEADRALATFAVRKGMLVTSSANAERPSTYEMLLMCNAWPLSLTL